MRNHSMTKAAEHDALEFPADTILPIQYFGMTGPQTFSCEQRLMLAVLVDAINVLGHSRIFPNGRHSGSFDEAFSWVFADGIRSPLSFDRVCEALDVDPASLRSRLSGLLSNHSGALRRLRLKESSRFQTVTANRVRLRAELRRPPRNQSHDDARR